MVLFWNSTGAEKSSTCRPSDILWLCTLSCGSFDATGVACGAAYFWLTSGATVLARTTPS